MALKREDGEQPRERNRAWLTQTELLRVRREIGGRIASERSRAGLTQTELGERVGLGQRQVSSIELGVRAASAERLVLVARALGCAASYLLEGGDPSPRHGGEAGGG